MFDKLRSVLGGGNKSPNPGASIRLEEDGFLAPSSNQIIRWDEVTSIKCFKRDLLTTDLVCVVILSGVDGAQRVELNEEMPGFDRFCLEMLKIIPNELRDWRKNIVAPAFATKELQIYQRG